MEYMVKDHDSLERIAAFHDCTVGELMKMNRMGSRMVILFEYFFYYFNIILQYTFSARLCIQ